MKTKKQDGATAQNLESVKAFFKKCGFNCLGISKNGGVFISTPQTRKERNKESKVKKEA